MSDQNSSKKSIILREGFATLLDGFSLRAKRDRATVSPTTTDFRELLEEFITLRNQADESERTHAADDHKRFHALLEEYGEAVERHRQHQEEFADDFNLLDVLRLTGNEIRHSMVLAWLLDHDLRRLGTHAQGSLGFRLFLEEFREIGFPVAYADSKYWVRREVGGNQSIIDIEVACRRSFLIHIENKIWSTTDQTDREWPDVLRRAADLEVSAQHVHALFLTPQGVEPKNKNFVPISWGRIVPVLKKFSEQAKPRDVKLFAAHCTLALRRFVAVHDDYEDEDGDATLQ